MGIMDADLQDEPEVLMQMYKLLREENLDVVYAVRASRPEGRVKRFCYYVFYRLYTFLADTPVNLDSGDFCVMTRRAVKLLLSLQRRLCSSKSVRATRPRNLAPYRNMHSILPPSRNIDTRDWSTRAHCPDVNRSTAEYHYRAVRKPMGLPHVCSGYRLISTHAAAEVRQLP